MELKVELVPVQHVFAGMTCTPTITDADVQAMKVWLEQHNPIERAVVMASELWILPEHLKPSLALREPNTLDGLIPGARMAEIERIAILRTLEAVGGSTSRAARMLGISTRKIQYRLREYRADGHLGGAPARS